MMQTPDIVNGLFEFCGGAVNWLNVAALMKDKKVRGVRILPTFLFSVWGYWNLWYYPHLNQWVSFIGGIAIVLTNSCWALLAIYYIHFQRPRHSMERMRVP